MSVRPVLRKGLAALLLAVALSGSARGADTGLLPEGQALYRSGDYRAAAALLERAARDRDLAPQTSAMIELVRAQALTEAGDYAAGLVAARRARELTQAAHGELSEPHFQALLVLARVASLAGGSTRESLDILISATPVAKALSGDHGVHAVELTDRVSLVLAGSSPSDALKLNDQAIADADQTQGISPTLLARLANTRGVILSRARRYAEARDAFEVAANGRIAVLGPGHPDTLTSRHNYAATQRLLGEAADAERILAEVLPLRTAALGADHPDTLTTRRLLAALRLARGDEAALRDLRDVAGLTARRYGPAHVTALEAEASLARGLDAFGRSDEAISHLDRSYRAAASAHGGDDATTLDLGHQLGLALHAAGREAEALALLDQVLLGTLRLHPENHPDVLATLNAVASVASALGRHDRACATYEQVLAALPEGPGSNASDRLTVRNNLAICRWDSGDRRGALAAMADVIRDRKATLGDTHPLALSSASTQAAWLSQTGRADEAIALQREVFAVRAAKGRDSPDALRSQHNLAAALDEAAHRTEALELYRDVVARRDRVLGARHPATVLSRRMLAGLLLQSDDWTEARGVYQIAIDAVESSRAEAALSDSGRREYFATVADLHKVSALLELAADRPGEALLSVDRAKARTLLDLTSARGATRQLLPAVEAQQLAALELRVAALDLEPRASDATAEAARLAQRNGAARDTAALADRLAKRFPSFAAARRPVAVTTDTAARLLPADGVFLQYLALGDRVAVFWLLPDGRSGGLDLGYASALADTVQAYRAAMADPRGIAGLRNPPLGALRRQVWALRDGGFVLRPAPSGAPDDGARLLLDAVEMRDALSLALLAPLPVEVRSARTWIVSPDGPLTLLPFDTLRIGRASVLADHDVSYAPSLSTYVLQAERRQNYARLRRAPMLAIGDPAYVAGENGFSRLPASATELENLRSLFRLKLGKDLFVGDQASPQVLQRLSADRRLEGARFLVISAHGIVDPDTPERNAVVLSPGSSAGGYMRAADLMGLRLRTDLVFLSACDTAVGVWRNGEGVLGLPFALVVSGSAGAVLTQWSIPDPSTAEFSRRFFVRLARGEGAAAALATTKREFAAGDAGEAWRAPAFWAAFVLYGS